MENSKLFESLEEAGIEGISYNRNIQKLHCPQCHDQRKNKRDKSLSLNLAKGVWNCHHCQWSGGLKKSNWTPPLKDYRMPTERELPLGDKIITWFERRGIERRTLEYFKIGEEKAHGDKGSWIIFPYRRDGKLVNEKKRNGQKDFRMHSGAELIFFNLDAIWDKETAIITEGEIDCMTLYQCNFFNVVSVPNGASKGDAKLEYLDNCHEYFDGLKKVIIATDGDEPGMALRNELARRIGKGKCDYVEYPDGTKDANDVLLKFGPEKVREIIESAKPFPVEGINSPGDYLNDVLNFYHNGFPKGDTLGHRTFDDLLSFRGGELTVITGIPNSGKSAFLDHVLVRLANRHGWKHSILSMEQAPYENYVMKITQVFSGRGLRDKSMSPEIITTVITKFLSKHFFLFGIDDTKIDSVLDKASQLVLQRGVNSLTIDPWNTLDHDGDDVEYIRRTLKKIVNFAKKYSVHIFLVAHPTKIPKDRKTGEFATPSLYDIAGAAHFFNMADNGISVFRNLGTRNDKTPPLGDTITVHVQKVRNFFIGKQGRTDFDFNFLSGNYAEENFPMDIEYDRWRSDESKGTQLSLTVPVQPPKPLRFPDISAADQIATFESDPSAMLQSEEVPF